VPLPHRRRSASAAVPLRPRRRHVAIGAVAAKSQNATRQTLAFIEGMWIVRTSTPSASGLYAEETSPYYYTAHAKRVLFPVCPLLFYFIALGCYLNANGRAVFFAGGNPVSAGLVASFNRPGGNVTGISFMNDELTAKRLELLHELVPSAVHFALLFNPNGTGAIASLAADTQAAASAIRRQLEVFTASNPGEIDLAFASMVQRRVDALLIGPSVLLGARWEQVATLAARYGLPTIHFAREFAEAGGLMSYGSSLADMTRQAGVYVGRILKGEKPADLPVQQPTKFELVINLKTAKALGLTIPETLLATADQVIE
jgi:ABC-type uncharacterized transport system substrate-binding protein